MKFYSSRYTTMKAKINVRRCVFDFFAGIGVGYVFVVLYKKISPHLSWGTNMCKIYDVYECSSYNDLCDFCAEDVHDEVCDKLSEDLHDEACDKSSEEKQELNNQDNLNNETKS